MKARLFILISAVVIICILASCSAKKESVYLQLAAEGDALFSKQKYSDAIRVWKKALAVNSHAVDLYYKSGLACMRMEDYSMAEQFFYKVIECKPSDWEAWIKVGRIRLLLGDASAAQEIWNNIPSVQKKEPGVVIFHGDLLFRQHKLREAEKAYRQSLSIDGTSQESLIKLGLCLLAENRSEEADQLFERLKALKPSRFRILAQMACYCGLSGKIQMAEKYYREALRVEPSCISCSIGLAELYVGNSQNDKALEELRPIADQIRINSLAKKQLAGMLLSLGQLSDAGKIIDDLYRDKNDDIEVLMLKGKYHLLSREPAMAVAFYRAATEIRPRLAPVLYWLGTSYLLGGHEQLGMQSLVAALSIDGDYSNAELMIADYYYKKKDYPLASEYARRVIDQDTGNVRGFMIIGNILFAQERFSDAAKMFEKAERLAPKSLPARYYKARAMELDGHVEEALVLYSEILKQDSDLADVSKSYSLLLAKTRGVDAAIDFLEKSAIEMPQNGYIQLILGKVYWVAGRKNEAIEAYRLAIERTPGLGSTYLELFDIYERDKEFEKQKKILDLAISNIPKFSEAYSRLGLLYLSEHREMEAVQLLEKGYDLNHKDPYLANNLATIYLDLNIKPIKAFHLAQSAYKQFPDNPAFSDTLGWAYCKRGIYRMALWHFNDALRQLEENKKRPHKTCSDSETFHGNGEYYQVALSAIYYHKGIALFKSGEKENATESIRKAKKLGLSRSDIDKAEKLLGQMLATDVNK